MSHLLIWTLGPVQDFIKTARKARDLWFGSWLLAELARAAAKSCVGSEGIEALIFPAPADIAELERMDVPNRIVAIVDNPDACAQAMDQAARDKLDKLAMEVMDQVSKIAADRFDRGMAMAQVRDLLELSWVSVPMGSDYSKTRALAERLIAAHKSHRRFGQPTWDGSRPKSSLDGAREVVLVLRKGEKRLPEKLCTDLGLKPKEQLSGVDLLKRVGGRMHAKSQDQAIDSTTHVAARAYLRLLREHPGALPELNDYLKGLPEEVLDNNTAKTPMFPGFPRRDGGLLYPSRLEDYRDSCGDLAIDSALAALKALLRGWREHTDRSEPSPYYCALMADGDKLGAYISHLKNPTDQRTFGQQLSSFAAQAKEIIAQHHGQTVYAGGDDVMALLPTHSAFAAAKELAQRFYAITGCTLSAGLCIGHHTSPLQGVLEGAREAERHAKQQIGRDGWAIKQDKRSGSPILIGGHWDSPAGFHSTATMLEFVRAYSASDDDHHEQPLKPYPRGLPYDLDQAQQRLPADACTPADKLKSMRQAEVYRILIQKQILERTEKGFPLQGKHLIEQATAALGLDRTAKHLIIARNLGAGL